MILPLTDHDLAQKIGRTRLFIAESQVSFKDQTLLSVLPELCHRLFGEPSFKKLSETQKKEVLRQLRFRFSSNIHQLARITGLSYDAAARLMDSE